MARAENYCKTCKTNAYVVVWAVPIRRGSDRVIDQAHCENCGHTWKTSKPYLVKKGRRRKYERRRR